jgi:hypothetical protein
MRDSEGIEHEVSGPGQELLAGFQTAAFPNRRLTRAEEGWLPFPEARSNLRVVWTVCPRMSLVVLCGSEAVRPATADQIVRPYTR